MCAKGCIRVSIYGVMWIRSYGRYVHSYVVFNCALSTVILQLILDVCSTCI